MTAAVALAIQPIGPAVAVIAAQATTTKPAPGTTKPAASASPAAQTTAPDGGWPRLYELNTGGDVLVYQPQVASWDNQKAMVAYSAVSYRAKPSDQPKLGTIKIEATTRVSTTERLVGFADMKIAEVNFHDLDKNLVREMVGQLDQVLSGDERIIALDRVLTSVDKSNIVPKNVEGVKATPPPIFFSQTPAIMVNIDGEPIWSPIKEVDLKFAVNTNWDLFEHTPTKTFYLRFNDSWLTATDITAAWKPAGKLPDSFQKLPADDNWMEVKAALPGRTLAASAMPKVFLST
jgi:hypothetical protein